MTDNASTAWEDCWWEDRVPQSVKGDLVVDLSRTTTPETIQFSQSDVKNLVSSVDSDWVLRQRLTVKTQLIPASACLLQPASLARELLHFREHHFKDHKLKGDSIAFVGLIGGRAVCYTTVTPEARHFLKRGALSGLWPANHGYPDNWCSPSAPRMLFREHRTVVLPDFQGMGLAPLLCNAVAKFLHDLGHDFTSQTVHPFYGSYRDRSPFWQPLPTNQKLGSSINGNLKYSQFFVGAVQRDGTHDPELLELLDARVKRNLS